MIIDKLYESVEKKGHVCVGLDTCQEYIPKSFLSKFSTITDAIFEFNKKIIDETLDVCACYKVQIAFYESLGIEGLKAYKKTLKYIRSSGAIVIADIKRGDISSTASMYAKAHFEGDFESDFITLNPYMGMDSIEPYLNYVKNDEKGLFVLIRTSNKGAQDIQYINSKGDQKVYDIVSEKVQKLGAEYLGNCGYSSIGGVMGCTHPEEAARLRKNLDRTFFLIPGYGAQGGSAKDVALYLKNGNGGIVNSSRGILLAYRKHENGENTFWQCAREEVIKMKLDIMKHLIKV